MAERTAEAKKCTRCKQEKETTDFPRNVRSADGLAYWCKGCNRETQNRRRVAGLVPPEQLEKARQRARSYYYANKAKCNRRMTQYFKRRRAEDPVFRLVRNLRCRTRDAIRDRVSALRSLELLGCTPGELRDHLTGLFKPGMTMNNYGTYWHVDHVRPLASFDLSDPEQVKQCFHYTNLQPLTVEENLKKGARYGN